jgi:hypothetical protein
VASIRYSSFGRRGLIASAGSLLATPAIVRAQGQNGVALVIGNSKYQWEAPLPNVRRDAPDIAKAFQALELKTELLQDVGNDAMRRAIQKFAETSRGARLAAFYFAGHGATWDKQTYVVPVDADLSNPSTVKNLIGVPDINNAMKGAANRFLVFDSCRNNPADGWRQREARMAAVIDAADRVATDLGESNTLTLFSTASGAIALDGPAGENSPFAAVLLRHLGGSSVDLQALPPKLRRDLLLATECRQLLWDQNTYTQAFTLNGPGKPATSIPHDPARIVEFPNAFAFGRKNGLVLPDGLIGYRSANPASDGFLIGSYEWDSPARVGATGGMALPAIIVIISATASGATGVHANKDWRIGIGTRWRYETDFVRTEKGMHFLDISQQYRFEFNWRDRNGGRLGSVPVATTANFTFWNKPFSRLDG